jgi:hypothetical protein
MPLRIAARRSGRLSSVNFGFLRAHASFPRVRCEQTDEEATVSGWRDTGAEDLRTAGLDRHDTGRHPGEPPRSWVVMVRIRRIGLPIGWRVHSNRLLRCPGMHSRTL